MYPPDHWNKSSKYGLRACGEVGFPVLFHLDESPDLPDVLADERLSWPPHAIDRTNEVRGSVHQRRVTSIDARRVDSDQYFVVSDRRHIDVIELQNVERGSIASSRDGFHAVAAFGHVQA